jgi:hypothetical protein
LVAAVVAALSTLYMEELSAARSFTMYVRTTFTLLIFLEDFRFFPILPSLFADYYLLLLPMGYGAFYGSFFSAIKYLLVRRRVWAYKWDHQFVYALFFYLVLFFLCFRYYAPRDSALTEPFYLTAILGVSYLASMSSIIFGKIGYNLSVLGVIFLFIRFLPFRRAGSLPVQ